MIGIGIDITPLERISVMRDKYGDKFLDKLLAEGEQGGNVETLAGLWAAKEAVAKALGTGYNGFGPTDICILREALGAPSVELRGKAADIAMSRGITTVKLSISHAAGLAVACAVALA
ncbi:MAG: holo-ACP synthase [Bacillota bacterium]|nr:holo-ACP synthase [Bacillota bacterium]